MLWIFIIARDPGRKATFIVVQRTDALDVEPIYFAVPVVIDTVVALGTIGNATFQCIWEAPVSYCVSPSILMEKGIRRVTATENKKANNDNRQERYTHSSSYRASMGNLCLIDYKLDTFFLHAAADICSRVAASGHLTTARFKHHDRAS